MNRKYVIRLGIVLGIFVLLLISRKTPEPDASVQHRAPAPAANTSVLGTATKTTGCVSDGTLPDSACTPGAADPRVTQTNIQQTICVSGYSSSVRPPVSVTDPIKTQEMLAYGDTGTKADYELDHLISLEIGGCPDCVANLWPEPYNNTLGAHEKDKVVNYLHAKVCDGLISLSEAQSEIAKDWVSVYKTLP